MTACIGLKLILSLERQNQSWFQVGHTNLLFVVLLAAGSLPMNQWKEMAETNKQTVVSGWSQ